MSSFFTTPASQRKRKRSDAKPASTSNKRSAHSAHRSDNKPSHRRPRDESISGSDSDFESSASSHYETAPDTTPSSEDEDETGADRRRRIAEEYLENIRDEHDIHGFDAEEIDREIIARRLKEDVAETKGKLYRHIAEQLAFENADSTQFKSDQFCITGVAACPPYAYTVAKDMSIAKWEIMEPERHEPQEPKQPSNVTARQKPKFISGFTGNKSRSKDPKFKGHIDQILCIAVSTSGKFLATGGKDRRLVIWDAETMRPLKMFRQHRDAIMGVSFRRNTHTLFTASADRTIKIWSADTLAYVETLFGHQDHVVDIAGLAQEKCISVGARDRTARLWKVVEETQLVYRGSGSGSSARDTGDPAEVTSYAEGSIDRVVLIDEDLFVTGSDNGSIRLWSIHRKKPVWTVPLAHGLDPMLTPEESSADVDFEGKVSGRAQPRWITALAVVPYSDLVVSGSWDGVLRVWRVAADKRSLVPVGTVGGGEGQGGDGESVNELGAEYSVRGIVTDLAMFERGDRGKDGLCIVAGVSREHRLGEWKKMKKGKFGAVVFEVKKRSAAETEGEQVGIENGLL